MKKILPLIVTGLTVVFLTMTSYAQAMKQLAPVTANVVIRSACTPWSVPAVSFHAYLENGDWLAASVSGDGYKILKNGNGEIDLADKDGKPSAHGVASYCQRPPEVPDKEVEPECKNIPLKIVIESVDLEGDGHVKGRILWLAPSSKSMSEIQFDTKYKKLAPNCG